MYQRSYSERREKEVLIGNANAWLRSQGGWLKKYYSAGREAYAAAAAKLSNGFATVVQDIRITKRTINAEMTASLRARPPRKVRTQSGAISIIRPRDMMRTVTKWSILASEI